MPRRKATHEKRNKANLTPLAQETEESSLESTEEQPVFEGNDFQRSLRSLTPNQVLGLQHTIGNRAVIVRRLPIDRVHRDAWSDVGQHHHGVIGQAWLRE